MKIGFIALCGVREQGELGNAKNFSIDILYAGPPELLGVGGVRE